MPKTKPNHQNRFNPYGFVCFQQPTKMFKCSIDQCGAIFPYKSVLQVHQMKEHMNDSRFKKLEVAIVKPIMRVAPLSSAVSPQKMTTLLTKQPKIVLKDILAKEHYILDEHDQFKCPVCDKSMASKSIVSHLTKSNHKSLLKFIKPRVKCADCSELVHPHHLHRHKRTTCKGDKQLALSYWFKRNINLLF